MSVIKIYKITNTKNNKVYIGQTVRPIKQRFLRHITDALNNKLDTHFARAIRYHGKESFIVEEIDTATTQDELNLKEQYWIRYYNSTICGYNETDALCKCGGNTYRSKTSDDMDKIKDKIRQTKLGSKNPNARKIKRIDIVDGTVDIFDTVIDCARGCGISNGKTSIVERLGGRVQKPYKNRWVFEYYNE